MTRYGEKETLTQELLDNIATYMNDDIRGDLAFELAPCTPEMFLREYVKQDLIDGWETIMDVDLSEDKWEVKKNA